MAVTLLQFPPPPIDTKPFLNTRTGIFSPAWQRWFLALARAFAIAVAPGDAAYIVARANASLSAAINLGALASGYLRITTALGVATVASVQVLSSQLEPTGDVSIPANEGVVVPDRFVIAAGRTLTLGVGSVFQIT